MPTIIVFSSYFLLMQRLCIYKHPSGWNFLSAVIVCHMAGRFLSFFAVFQSDLRQHFTISLPARAADPSRAHRTAAFALAGAGKNRRLPHMPLGTAPPHAAMAASRDPLGRQRSVERRVPLCRDLGRPRCQVVESRQHLMSRAIRAAAPSRGAGGNNSRIGMPLFTYPPHFAVGTRRHLLRRQFAVSRRMPLRRDRRKLGLQIIFPGLHPFAGTHRAAAADRGPGCDLRLPCMAFFTQPPHPSAAARHDVPRRQPAVSRRMPLRCQRRKLGLQVVFSEQNLFFHTNRTAASMHTGLDLSLPHMPLFAFPPHQPMAARQDVPRRQRTVFGWVPLRCQRRIAGPQVILACQRTFPGTKRTARAADTGINRCLPAVPLVAAPPYLPFAAVRDPVRCQRCIARNVPLCQQITSIQSHTIGRQRFPHRLLPLHYEINIL